MSLKTPGIVEPMSLVKMVHLQEQEQGQETERMRRDTEEEIGD